MVIGWSEIRYGVEGDLIVEDVLRENAVSGREITRRAEGGRGVEKSFSVATRVGTSSSGL